MALTIQVRIFVPGTRTRADSVGHYDMIIEGDHYFNDVLLTNPVFSYRVSSELHIFEESATSNYYPHNSGDYYYDCAVYKWSFTFENDDYNGFIDALRGVISGCSQISDDEKAFKCTLKADNPFSIYDYKKYNCFYAVAVWLYYFGDFTLKAIYGAAHDNAYREYSPANMASKYSNMPSWSRYSP